MCADDRVSGFRDVCVCDNIQPGTALLFMSKSSEQEITQDLSRSKDDSKDLTRD